MKIYGTGVLTAPGTQRIIWDFSDGPFDTVNEALIQEAKRRGFSLGTPPLQQTPVPKQETKSMGGKPSKATSADQRLKRNNPKGPSKPKGKSGGKK